MTQCDTTELDGQMYVIKPSLCLSQDSGSLWNKFYMLRILPVVLSLPGMRGRSNTETAHISNQTSQLTPQGVVGVVGVMFVGV